MGLTSQGFQFLIQGLQLLLEVLVADLLARSDTDIASGVEGPPLDGDLLGRGGLAETRDVTIGQLLPEDLLELGLRRLPAKREVRLLAPLEPHDIR